MDRTGPIFVTAARIRAVESGTMSEDAISALPLLKKSRREYALCGVCEICIIIPPENDLERARRSNRGTDGVVRWTASL